MVKSAKTSTVPKAPKAKAAAVGSLGELCVKYIQAHGYPTRAAALARLNSLTNYELANVIGAVL